MEKKLSVLNLADELAEKSGITTSQAEAFVRAFFDVLADGLAQDNIVKVKGWGTFKLSAVSDRESVDVNTGERIVIKGYRKVSFLPETALKEHINKPFAQFEATELNDNYSIDDETVEVEGVGPDADAQPLADEVEETLSPAAEEMPEEQKEIPALETQKEPEDEPESETPTEIKSKPEAEFESGPKPEESTEIKAEVEAVVEPESETKAEPELIPATEDELEIEPSSEAEPETETKGELETESETKTKSNFIAPFIKEEYKAEEYAKEPHNAEEIAFEASLVSESNAEQNDIETITSAKEEVGDVSSESVVPEPSVPEPISESSTTESKALKQEAKEFKRTRRPRRSWHYWLPIVLLLLITVCLYIYITFGRGFEKPKFAISTGEKENIKVERIDFDDKKPNIVIKTGAPKQSPTEPAATPKEENDTANVTLSVATTADAKAVEAVLEEAKTVEIKTVEVTPEEARTVEVKTVKAIPEEAKTVQVKSAETKPIETKTAQAKTDAQPVSSGEKSLKDITLADTTAYVILGTKATHTVQEGETIVQLARKYYNDKRLWPYIVKHNGLKNPNAVQVGKSIAIPELKSK